MNKRYILFDLDGTLTDPMVGITNSVAYALAAFGIQVEDKTALCAFIGPPLTDSFREYYGFSQDQALLAIKKYREYFAVKGIFENRVYAGIPQLLAALKAQGRLVLLATSKPEVFARQILEHFHLAAYFDTIAGSNLDGTRVIKAEVIAYALGELGVANFNQAVMIGDRRHDIIGAKKCGLESIGVLYGYGSEEELRGAGADYLAAGVGQLKELLLEEPDRLFAQG